MRADISRPEGPYAAPRALPDRARAPQAEARAGEPRPPLAVVVSDREWSGRAVATVLAGAGYATLRTESADQALALCAAASPDLVFVERGLGDVARPGREGRGVGRDEPGGVALVRRLRLQEAVSEAAPIVLITADAVRRADVLDALTAGAWELCTLPGDSTALLARCAVWVRAKRHADRAADAALVDPETGFYNMRGLLRRAREAAGASRRATGHSPLACIAFSVAWPDDAPRVVAGTRESTPGAIARRVLEACAAGCRASDVVGRVGRREFAILAPATPTDGASRLVARLLGTLGDGATVVRATTALSDAGDLSDDDAIDVVVRAVSALYAGE